MRQQQAPLSQSEQGKPETVSASCRYEDASHLISIFAEGGEAEARRASQGAKTKLLESREDHGFDGTVKGSANEVARWQGYLRLVG
jgi:hypothetical protein